jgi:hypothetical protein
MGKEKRIIIIHNRAKCLRCEDIIESYNRHDFKWCTCRAVFVDGGHEYLRRGGEMKDIEELSEVEEIEEQKKE